MKKETKQIFHIFLRYLVLLLIAIPNMFILYWIFTPITVYLVYFVLNLFYSAVLVSSNVLLVEHKISIELINACIAGSAYYLLLALNLSTRGIKAKKRILLLLSSLAMFLLVNVLRIFLLSSLALFKSPLFDATHFVFWYALSTFFVVGIWFLNVKLFKIESIPFYSDAKFFFQKSLFNRKTKSRRTR